MNTTKNLLLMVSRGIGLPNPLPSLSLFDVESIIEVNGTMGGVIVAMSPIIGINV